MLSVPDLCHNSDQASDRIMCKIVGRSVTGCAQECEWSYEYSGFSCIATHRSQGLRGARCRTHAHWSWRHPAGRGKRGRGLENHGKDMAATVTQMPPCLCCRVTGPLLVVGAAGSKVVGLMLLCLVVLLSTLTVHVGTTAQ